MAFPAPRFSREEVNKAGRILAAVDSAPGELEWATEVLSNWRACHGHPINTFQALLRSRVKDRYPGALVAQRLKRSQSIIDKLQRLPGMKLSRMQDIGGIRAVVRTVNKVRQLRDEYKSSRFPHVLTNEKDYIAAPKPDGYRSVHLVYRYQSRRAPEFDGLQIELQIRTNLQHAWATAVETMSTFLGQALKSQQGDQRYLEFFSVTGAAFAWLERSRAVPGYEDLSEYETYRKVLSCEQKLKVLDSLQGFSLAVGAIKRMRGKGSYHLIVLDMGTKRVTVKPYGTDRLNDAVDEYARQELRAQNGEPIEAVLVSGGPVEKLRKAYPNYFLDTRQFVKQVHRVMALAQSPEPPMLF